MNNRGSNLAGHVRERASNTMEKRMGDVRVRQFVAIDLATFKSNPGAILEIPSLESSLAKLEREIEPSLQLLRSLGWDRHHDRRTGRWVRYEPWGSRREFPDPSPQQIEQARANLTAARAEIVQSLLPSGRQFTAVLLGVLKGYYTHARIPKEQAAVKADVYLTMLSHFPPDLLSKSAKNHVAFSNFFPTVAELQSSIVDLLEIRSLMLDGVDHVLGEAGRGQLGAAPPAADRCLLVAHPGGDQKRPL